MHATKANADRSRDIALGHFGVFLKEAQNTEPDVLLRFTSLSGL